MMDSKQIEIEGMKELLKEDELEIGRLRKEIKKLKNLKICGKTVEERIEIDKGVVRDND